LVVNERLFAVGGFTDKEYEKPASLIEVYDADSDLWSVVEQPSPTPGIKLKGCEVAFGVTGA